MNTKVFAISVFALANAFGTLAHAAPATDEVVASFDRLLNHTPAHTPVATPATAKADADPLVASVNAVLWERPSYHLSTQYAALSKPEKKRN